MIWDDDLPEFDKNDPEFRKRPVCHHFGGDPDCDCWPEEDEDEIGEATIDEHFEAHIAEECEE